MIKNQLNVSEKQVSYKKIFNSHVLKLIAIITMVIDHLGYITFPDQQWMRMIGRIAFPLFAFGIAYGFEKTKNPTKYLWRLILLFLIIQVPESIFILVSEMDFGVSPFYFNIFLTLSMGAIFIYLWQLKGGKIMSIAYILLIMTIFIFISKYPISVVVSDKTYVLEIDYGLYGVLLIGGFFLIRESITFLQKKYNTMCALDSSWNWQKNIGAAVILIFLVLIDNLAINISGLNFSSGVTYFALIDTFFLLLFVDINIRLNRYLKYALYLAYPLSLVIFPFI